MNIDTIKVDLAIENQGNAEYIGYVFDRIKSDKLKFCFGSGHKKYYSPHLNLHNLYGDKLAALRLHDISGNDAHALPFSGACGGIEFRKISNQ